MLYIPSMGEKRNHSINRDTHTHTLWVDLEEAVCSTLCVCVCMCCCRRGYSGLVGPVSNPAGELMNVEGVLALRDSQLHFQYEVPV